MLIDATAVPADRGGVGRYVDSLVGALDQDGARLTVVCQPRDLPLYGQLAPSSRIVAASPATSTRTARLTWEQATLPRLVRRLAADVVHSPHYTMPLASGAASVVTLHDATFFTDAVLHSSVKARFFRAWTATALRRGTLCVVPSHATAVELARVSPVRHAELEIIHHGVDSERFHPPSPEEVAAARKAVGLGATPYIAFLGALEPRKNVPALIRGYARAVAGQRDAPALVLAGQPGWDTQVERALDAVPHRLRVIRAGYLPFGTLAGFLGGAELVAYPSLGEGFGLPVLEAMACGAAVLTTRRLSLPEVGGDAVAYCGVGAGDVAAALTELLADPSRRSVLASAAQRRAKEFSWTTTADRHREAYGKAWHQHLRNR
ncbi:glycosyltransferase family 4 protein [Amycolatopsis rubida]|uniref:Glycosyltransferase family 4 protein n=1 Tax=Amycolatopsis rubida TaxID=112413 RepID=A0A1I5XUG4_9PSEU|nr:MULTISPECIES: glycosyltransferase family 1 protein [Amycolatopsis]MYW90543.1 glycosyltransferase [Amycolatopsis rubida]NEC55524.1 glycosyltransferase family 4 protein [Amycolatopsis rubida]OAP22288.1 GDP-mannose-dependent alpha-(1-6)-phosphatidylinositol monomannoside mannosyltransferase [Amycolatopsis sp. M39]SFQ35595.1 Glycosyltransferase involved in cell wall bisynthesis [Amycolatopsis rubida]